VRPAALLRDRRGMTLTELLVAMVLLGIIIAPVFTFMRQQSDAFAMGSSRMMLTQNHRFAISALERDLRTAGSNIPLPGVQPTMVYAGGDVIAFNADYATRDTTDLFAVYQDTAAAPEEVDALVPARRITLPGTSFVYPGAAYQAGGGNSPAETIVFYFTPDATTTRTDDFVLMRQVNDRPPAVVARNILRTGGGPFFQYQELITPDSGASYVNTIASSSLPLAHTANLHGVPEQGDTLPASRIDQIRAVRVSFTVTNGATNTRQQTRSVSRLIRLPNSGMATVQMCGEVPQSPGAVTYVVGPGPGGNAQVTLTWGPSVDENGGEHDVLRYIVYRRLFSAPGFGDPVGSVSGGAATYTFSDTPPPSASYVYGIAAQDCTPAASAITPSATVTIP
jgi:prepilin-type N-terminal cleavage/methylation domain-containing protein